MNKFSQLFTGNPDADKFIHGGSLGNKLLNLTKKPIFGISDNDIYSYLTDLGNKVTKSSKINIEKPSDVLSKQINAARTKETWSFLHPDKEQIIAQYGTKQPSINLDNINDFKLPESYSKKVLTSTPVINNNSSSNYTKQDANLLSKMVMNDFKANKLQSFANFGEMQRAGVAGGLVGGKPMTNIRADGTSSYNPNTLAKIKIYDSTPTPVSPVDKPAMQFSDLFAGAMKSDKQ